MVTIDLIARAILKRDSLQARSLTQDFLNETKRLADVARPEGEDQRILAAAAALLELFAERRSEAPPVWTMSVGPLAEPMFLLKEAEGMKRLRVLCETASPEPLRRRNLYAPPNFLASA